MTLVLRGAVMIQMNPAGWIVTSVMQIPHNAGMLRCNQYRIDNFCQRITVCCLDWSDLPQGWEKSLLNLNTPDDLSRHRAGQP